MTKQPHNPDDDLRKRLKDLKVDDTDLVIASIIMDIQYRTFKEAKKAAPTYFVDEEAIKSIKALLATQTAQLKERVLQAIGEDEKFSLTDTKVHTDTGDRKYVRNKLRATQRAAIESVFKELE